MYLSFCNAKREDTTHVYITSQDYLDAMPGTGQDCSCEISPGRDNQAMSVTIRALTVYLYGTDTDPCRERLSIYTGKNNPIHICPAKNGNEYSYISNGDILFINLTVNRTTSLVIQLKTNRTQLGSERKGKVHLFVGSTGR